mgnify:CR=1 FL=1
MGKEARGFVLSLCRKGRRIVEKKDDLLFLTGVERFQRDVDHISFSTTFDRFAEGVFSPKSFRGADDAIEALDKTMHAEDDTSRRAAYDELREAVEDNVRIKRRLINRLDDAIELAQKRVEWNFKTAVPAFLSHKEHHEPASSARSYRKRAARCRACR